MAVRDDFTSGEVLAAADLNDTFGAKSDTASPTFTGTVTTPRLQTGGTAPTLPANFSGIAGLLKGQASPVTGKLYFGDGTGWTFSIANRSSSTDKDLMTFTDFGYISATHGPLAEWATYGVTWTAATTNPVLNNGTLTAKFSKVGRRMVTTMRMVAGSTTTFGSGQMRFSLPVARRADPSIISGRGVLVDVSLGNFYPVQVLGGNTGSNVEISYWNGSTSSPITATAPFTMASGDILDLGFYYETDVA